MIRLTKKQTKRVEEWAGIDAYERLEKASMGDAGAMAKAYRATEPLIAFIELLRQERPREADGSWPAGDMATARAVAERWQAFYEKEDDEGARRGEALAKGILEQLGGETLDAAPVG